MNKLLDHKSVGRVTPKLSFEWEISNFCFSCKNVGEYLVSPTFPTSVSQLAQWRLRLHPKGDAEKSRNWLSLYLGYAGNEKVAVRFMFSILDDKDKKVCETKCEDTVFDPSIKKAIWGYSKLISHEKLMEEKNRVLKDDKLKILCEIIFNSDFTIPKLFSSMNCTSENSIVSARRLQTFTDFEKLLESGDHSDVIINIGESKIQAHKAIIASRSPVFHAMFQHDMKEKEKNIVEITDVSYEVMKEVLRFMYASTVNDIQKIATDLLIAAEKYSVEGLKTLCEETLYENLKNENAIEFLKLADMCNAANLKSQVIEFIVRNQKAITEKQEFQLFGDLHSELQCELFRAVVAKNATQ